MAALKKTLKFKSKSGNTYIYDDVSGHIFNILDEDAAIKIAEYRGLCHLRNNVKLDITIGDIKFALYNLGIGFKQLLLEVTSICNFRCKYCTYSNHYKHTRAHGEKNMDFAIAKRAVDYYFENFKIVYKRNAQKKPIISFYGGEPLINFALIKKVVDYVKHTFPEFEVDYHITTNGFLMDTTISDFLYNNEFYILLSLDGNKENHDRNRLTLNNDKTFNKIFTNYIQFKNKYPSAKIFISACYDYKTDLNKMMNFFDENKIHVIQVNPVDFNTNTYYNQFSSEDILTFSNQLSNLKKLYVNKSIQRTLEKNKFLAAFLTPTYAGLAYHNMLGEQNISIKPYTGSCVPGEKMYITTTGDIKPCEKVGNPLIIGNVFNGLDFVKIRDILNELNSEAVNNCYKCPISKLCTLCYKNFQNVNGAININRKWCKKEMADKKYMLEEYVSLLEKDPALFEEVTTDYYKQLELGGGMF